jgi:benzoyl-CoA reductase/2-hydroxyglutaryl-CoA dehydratase subunit BcrC/BadD/HgdB
VNDVSQFAVKSHDATKDVQKTVTPRTSSPGDRRARLLAKTQERIASEEKIVLDWLRNQPDYRPSLAYFLELLSDRRIAAIESRCQRKAIRLLCNQIPLELILAAGFQPFKVVSGSSAEASYSAHNWPALMCPLIKGILTALELDPDLAQGAWVAPTSCDWVVKFWEARQRVMAGTGQIQWLELPHLKNRPESQKRWLEEVRAFHRYLEKLKGGKIARQALIQSIEAINRAWTAIISLKKARRDGRLSLGWFLAIMGAFFLDRLERWTSQVESLVLELEREPTGGEVFGARVFLAGSPIFFPNFKAPILLETAGLKVVADDLCSSERIFPGGQVFEDVSEYGLLASLAGRYHQGCLCPTFGDNERRVNNILSQRRESSFQGVVFVVLKGCHPYDLESTTIEETLKNYGLRFLRLETDYAPEDRQNLLTRLEAFGHSLSGVR